MVKGGSKCLTNRQTNREIEKQGDRETGPASVLGQLANSTETLAKAASSANVFSTETLAKAASSANGR